MAQSGSKKSPSKSEIFAAIAGATGLAKKQVAEVFQALAGEFAKAVGKKGNGEFVLPGLAKVTVQHKPATKARKGINPFTKQEVMFKAKPARNVVKVRPLKALKDMV